MRPNRPCLDCRRPTARGSRCPDCTARRDGPTIAIYASARWRHLSASVIRSWRTAHGPMCPGWDVPPHPSADLTADHRIPLKLGGDAFDRRNVTVLCRECNGRKGGV